MMQLIRDKAQGVVSWVIVGIIALVFASWGAGGFRTPNSSQLLAKVRGQAIYASEVDNVYSRWLESVSAQKGFNPALLNPVLIKQQITKSLAEQQAIISLLTSYHLRISDTVLMDVIRNNQYFQDDGKFSVEKYKQYLDRIRLSDAAFEQIRRNDLLANQAQHIIVDSSFSLNTEVNRLIAIENQKRSFNYMIVSPANYESAIKVSDAEIEEYYSKNKEKFVLPEKVSLEYVELSLDDLSGKTQVSEQEARDYFNKNLQLFAVKDFNKARKTVENSFKRDAAERLFSAKGEELANLAFEHPQSLTVVSEKLNLPIKTTAYFDKNGGSGITSLQEIINAAFSESVLVQQHNSDLIRISDDSYVVIHLKDRQPDQQQTLAEARSKIIKLLQVNDADLKAKQVTEQLIDELKKTKTPKQAWKTVSNASRSEKSMDPVLLRNIFSMPKPDASPSAASFKLPNGDYAVVVITKVTDGILDNSIDSNRHEMFAREAGIMNGNLQYSLLQASLIQRAKIKYMFD